MWPQNVCRLDDSLLPRRLWLAGQRRAGKEGPELPFLTSLLAAARVEAWLEGLLQCCCCWLLLDLLASQECSAPSPSRVLCCLLCLTYTGMHGKKCRASWPCGSGAGGAPTAAEESHSCWNAAGTNVRAGLYLYICGLRMCADSTTLSYLAVSGWLARDVRGKRDLSCRF